MSRHRAALVAVLLAVLPAVLLAACSANPSSTSGAETSAVAGTRAGQARVQVTVGHCFVEPVSFDGEQWNVPFDEQFGWGGGRPQDWRGTGLMVRTDKRRARYQDDGGAVVLFLLTDAARVRAVETAVCD